MLHIQAIELKQALKQNLYQILDVRTEAEYEVSHLPSIHIPLHSLEIRLHELNKQQTFVVLCRAGKRSLVAIEILKEHGFKNLLNLQGGLYAWKATVDPDFKLA